MKTYLALGVTLIAAALSADELHVAVAEVPVAVDGNMDEYVYVGYDWSHGNERTFRACRKAI